MKKTLFLTLAVLGVPSVYADTTVLADDEVSKYILKDDGSMSFEYKDGSDAISFDKAIGSEEKLTKKLTIEVGDGKTVTINGGVSKTSGTTTVNAGSIFASQGLEKTGAGDLNIRLNDVNRQVGKNDFSGSVTVSEGSMTLLHDNSNIISGYIGGGAAGEEVEVVVKKGAELHMMSYTGISVPKANESGADKYVQIDGSDNLNMDGTSIAGDWAKNEGAAVLSNVKVTEVSISSQSDGKQERAIVKADSVALVDRFGASADSLKVEKTDILATDFIVNGHSSLVNSRIYVLHVSLSNVDGNAGYGMLVTDSSEFYCAKQAWLSNVTVDATSKLQYVGTPFEDYDGVNLYGVNMLEMMGSQQGGLSQRVIGEGDFLLEDGGSVSAKTITYTTDQLSGDTMIVGSTLKVSLMDTDIAELLDADGDGTMDNVVFTLTLNNVDSSAFILDENENGLLDSKLIQLDIKDIENFTSESVAGYYDAQTNSTTFRFSNLANVELPSVPEPATATLSLLALAGLAARRRRKA